LTTALLSVICMLAFAPAASARVTVVPGSVQGGGTETLAVRLSNEQSDLATTRLELTFPTDVVIPSAQVAPMGKWVVTVDMRPVAPPVTVDGEEVDEAVASIVWTGGEVAPKQFEQFLVTVGPLPAEGGRLLLAAAQGYEDGTVDRWTAPAQPGWPGAPTLDVAPQAGAAEEARPTESGAAPAAAGSAAAPAAAGEERQTGGTTVLPWILLAAGVLVAGVGGAIGFRQEGQRKRAVRRRRTVRAAVRTWPLEKVRAETPAGIPDETRTEQSATGAGRR
jgi:uncharacterized protein YcnI